MKRDSVKEGPFVKAGICINTARLSGGGGGEGGGGVGRAFIGNHVHKALKVLLQSH